MTENHGAHGDAGATDNEDLNAQETAATNESAAASMDAQLESRAKNAAGHRRATWWIVAIVAVIAVVAVVAGCIAAFAGRKNDTTGAKANDTVTIGLKLAPTNLDIRNTAGSAIDQVLIGNVYEGLVARDEHNQVVPAIAKTWDVSDDGTTYTFHLNDGMTFSNGDKLDADDVAWSINELVTKQYHDADSLVNFVSVKASDPNTVELKLSAPYANLLWVLTGRPGLVFDKDAKYDAKTQAIGSGPYTVEKFVTNSSITLKANPNYWGANKANPNYWGANKAKTDTVVVRYFTDDNAAVNALKSGDVQVLAPISENLAEPFTKDSDHYVVKAGDDTDKFVLAFNGTGAKTSDKRVRQAIRYAINHKEIIASRGGSDTALGGPIPSLDPGYEDLTGIYPYDLDKAKSLMSEAGYSESKPLQLSLTYANIYGTELGDQLRSQLKPIGIDLKVNVVEFSTWLQDVYTNRNYDISLVDHNESHDFYQWPTRPTTTTTTTRRSGPCTPRPSPPRKTTTATSCSPKPHARCPKTPRRLAVQLPRHHRVREGRHRLPDQPQPDPVAAVQRRLHQVTAEIAAYPGTGDSGPSGSGAVTGCAAFSPEGVHLRFVIRRLLLFAAALFGISIVVFAALRVLPGDVASVMAGLNSPPERVAALRSQLGLDRPLIAQYADWIGALLHGDFGTSILTGRSISAQVGERASVTFPLIVLGLLIAMGLGIPLGCEATLAQPARSRHVSHGRHHRRRRARAVGRSAADPAVLARNRTDWRVSVAGIPPRRVVRFRFGADVAGVASLLGGHHRGCRADAVHPLGIGRTGILRLHRHGHVLWHDPPAGGAARGIAPRHAATGLRHRTDVRGDGHRRHGHREPVRAAGHRQRSGDRCRQP